MGGRGSQQYPFIPRGQAGPEQSCQSTPPPRTGWKAQPRATTPSTGRAPRTMDPPRPLGGGGLVQVWVQRGVALGRNLLLNLFVQVLTHLQRLPEGSGSFTCFFSLSLCWGSESRKKVRDVTGGDSWWSSVPCYLSSEVASCLYRRSWHTRLWCRMSADFPRKKAAERIVGGSSFRSFLLANLRKWSEDAVAFAVHTRSAEIDR